MGKLGGIILAAGLSSRMKDFKPLLKIGNMPMISWVVSMMQYAGAEPIVVVTGYKSEEVECILKNSSVIFVHNPNYNNTQMIHSLILGLKELKDVCNRIIITPADVPLIKHDTIENIVKADGDFVRPLFNGVPGHPVVLSSHLIPMIERYNGNGGLRGAIEQNNVEIHDVKVDDKCVIFDCDTKEDYEEILKIYEKFK